MEAIIERLMEYETAEEAVRSGVFLFHGTGETFCSKPRPGGDGLLWTVDNPLFAQYYIARPLTVYVGRPSDWEIDSKVSPLMGQSPFWRRLAEQLGYGPMDDSRISASGASWVVPPNWVTYRELCRILEEDLGYTADRGMYKLYVDDNDRVASADYAANGRVFVSLRDKITKLADLRGGAEGNLMDPDHLKFRSFEAARAKGHQSVLINDFAQSDVWGNAGHLAIGLFDKLAEEMEWLEFPAARHEPDNWRCLSTPHFDACFEELKQTWQARPSLT